MSNRWKSGSGELILELPNAAKSATQRSAAEARGPFKNDRVPLERIGQAVAGPLFAVEGSRSSSEPVLCRPMRRAKGGEGIE